MCLLNGQPGIEACVQLVARRYGGAGCDFEQHVARAAHRPDCQRQVATAVNVKC